MPSNKIASLVKTPTHNPALPRVSITLNSIEYQLEYDFNAIATAEELTGINLFSSFDFTHLTATKFRAMLYASLLKNHPKMTLDDAGKLITAHTVADITIKMVEAWYGSRPEVTEDEGNAEAEADDTVLQ